MSEQIIIVGSGFAGLGMGIRLKQAGISDFVILEREGNVGGTWRDNTYPGAACDIESHLYSFSFEPNPGWTRAYAGQKEILAYLEHCATKYGLHAHLRFGCGVESARYDDATSTWQVRTSDGQTLDGRVLVFACGGLSRPAYPDLAGLASFAGKTMHSARWDHAYDFAGKRVAVIGTGASAIQIVPELARIVEKLLVFQRTPPWILPKLDRPIPESERQWFARLPLLQKLVRGRQYLAHELLAYAFVKKPEILEFLSKLPVRFLRKSVKDEALRAKLLPDYTMGCKRILISNDYYPAICRPNVELITTPIREITPTGVVTSDGTTHAVDALVLATGFAAAEAVAPFTVHGRGGRDLAAVWEPGAEAYLGSTVAGFPNAFLLVGPNTGLGHNSMIYMIESQVQYVLDAIRTMRARGLRSVEVKPEVQDGYNQELHRRMGRTVWSTGCVSWYRTRSGKNTTLWPGFTFEFRRRTRRFRPTDYLVAS